jgi:hypothetical protein
LQKKENKATLKKFHRKIGLLSHEVYHWLIKSNRRDLIYMEGTRFKAAFDQKIRAVTAAFFRRYLRSLFELQMLDITRMQSIY